MPADVSPGWTRALASPDRRADAHRPGAGRRRRSRISSRCADRGDRHLTAVPGTAVRTDRRRTQARRLRWAAPIAVAAGVLAFAGFGIDYLRRADADRSRPRTARAAGSAAENAPMIASDSAGGLVRRSPSDEQILASGTDYRAAPTLGAGRRHRRQMARRDAAERIGEARKSAGLAPEPTPRRQAAAGSAPGRPCRPAWRPSRRRTTAARSPCRRSTTPASRAVPAVVVRFTAGGQSWAWASGPDCGTPGRGADRLYRVQGRLNDTASPTAVTSATARAVAREWRVPTLTF